MWPACCVAIGGAETVIGAILGSAVVTLLPEYFQPLKEWRLLVFGITVMVLIAVRPQGLYTRHMQQRIVSGVMRMVRLVVKPAGLMAAPGKKKPDPLAD